jgi:hypothetical protein
VAETFQTVSPRTPVNKGKKKGNRAAVPAARFRVGCGG